MKRLFVVCVLCVLVVNVVAPLRICTVYDDDMVVPFAGEGVTRFAVIGDLGARSSYAQAVVELVNSWEPAFILTVGDNVYAGYTLDETLGGYDSDVFPTLGNHDWDEGDRDIGVTFSDFPNYYDFVRGSIHFFALSSDKREPDGVTVDSVQAMWLQDKLSQSTSVFQVVYMHHPPYSSGTHGASEWMQWPYAEWGADVVISGHDHLYERIMRDNIVYIINGLGGRSRYGFRTMLVEDSEAQYSCQFGAMLVDATDKRVEFYFVNTDGVVVDYYFLRKRRG